MSNLNNSPSTITTTTEETLKENKTRSRIVDELAKKPKDKSSKNKPLVEVIKAEEIPSELKQHPTEEGARRLLKGLKEEEEEIKKAEEGVKKYG